ncbi:MAG: 30S ribosomal protein S6, partial [Flavobacteriales bacterium]|nr:30S ribosomal protein S6 [Flavobacteriales bacterium]
YPIQKKSSGFYQLFEFEAEAPVILPFETEFRRDERIIRFLSTRMDKHHTVYAESRRNKSSQAPTAAPETAEEA